MNCDAGLGVLRWVCSSSRTRSKAAAATSKCCSRTNSSKKRHMRAPPSENSTYLQNCSRRTTSRTIGMHERAYGWLKLSTSRSMMSVLLDR